MTNKFKYGEVVFINGKGKISNKLIKSKIGIVKEKEYYYNDYYVEVFFGQDDWFNENDLTRAIERVNGKTKKYDVMIVSTSDGINKIYENLKEISKDNKWDKINLKKNFSKSNIEYCALGWNNTYWPETNKSVMAINNTIKTFRANNIPYQYLIVGKNIDYLKREEFIENDSNVDVVDISVKLKI